MNKNSRALIFVILIFIAFVVIGVFVSIKVSQKKSVPSTKIPPPKIETAFERRLNIESLLQEGSIQIPNQLAVYKLNSTPFSLDESNQISSNLGFAQNPQTPTDARFGVVYLWSDQKLGNLRIVSSLRIVDYKTPYTPETLGKGSFVQEAEIVAKAKQFLTDSSLANEGRLLFPEVRFLSVSDESINETTKELANIANVRFKETVNQYPIVNRTTEVGTLDVKLDYKNNVVSIYSHQFGLATKGEEYPLKTFAELVTSLPEAKIQSLDNANVEVYSVSGVEKVTVENASIAYYQEFYPTQTLLQPIFVLTGTVKLTDRGDVPVLLYLSAVSSRFQTLAF